MCALLYLLFVSHYSVDVPNADDWGVIPLVSDAVHHQLTTVELWSQYGDTRLFVGRLFFAAFGLLDHLNERHVILFGAGIYIAAFILLLFLFRAYLRRQLTFLPVLSLGIVWFSLADFQNALWSFQLAWYLVVFFFVVIAFSLMIPHRHRNLFLALAAGAAALASLSEVQGFVVWAVGLICILWASPRVRRTYYECAVWISAAALTTAVYLYNFNFRYATGICEIEGGTKEGCTLSYGVRHPIPLAKFVSILAGNVVPTLQGTHVGSREALGAAIWIAAGFVVVQSIRERRLGTSALPVVLIVFALQFDLLLALSRLGQGAVGAGKTWYTMPNIILLGGIVVYAWGHVPDLRKLRHRVHGRDGIRIFGFAALTALIAIQLVVATQFGVSNARLLRARNVANGRILANLAVIPDAKRDCYLASVAAGPSLEFLYSTTAIARQDSLTLFGGGSADRYRAQGPPTVAQCG